MLIDKGLIFFTVLAWILWYKTDITDIKVKASALVLAVMGTLVQGVLIAISI